MHWSTTNQIPSIYFERLDIMNAPRTHTVPAGTMAAALLTSGAAAALAFEFDLVGNLKGIHVHEFGNQLLSRTAFACDAYINNSIRQAVTKLRADQELAGTAPWDSYQAFLSFVAGIAYNQSAMKEAGMEITPLKATVQKLFNLRTEIHDVLVERIGSSYETPDITDWMRKPRLQKDDANTVAKKTSGNRMLATDLDTGTIDVDLEKQLNESMAMKDEIDKQEQLKWDKKRGELHAMMFHALKINEYALAGVTLSNADKRSPELSEEAANKINEMKDIANGRRTLPVDIDPFGDLDEIHQFKLMAGLEQRYIPNVLHDIAKDRKVPYTVHAAAAVEAQKLLKTTRVALKHPRFKNVQV